jgi:hypothetical protein
MNREFIRTNIFEEDWKDAGLNDDDLRELENILLENPEAGALIRGAGGARKVRIAFPGQGKSGSGRVIYVDFAVSEHIYLLLVYAKSKQVTLSDAQKKATRELIGGIRKEEQRRGK